MSAFGPGPINYQWRFNGTNINGATGTNFAITNAQFSHSGAYSVVVSNPNETNVITAQITVTDEIILTSAQVFLSGSSVWKSLNAGADKFSPRYFYTETVNGFATAEAIYRPNIPVAGRYDVFIWHPQAASRSTNTPIYIFYNGGEKQTNINQTIEGGRWRLLAARRSFAQGTSGFLRISNNSGETNRTVVADAVRFKFRPNLPEPTGLIAPRLQPGGTFHFSFGGEAGSAYAVDVSTNLVQWNTLTNLIPGTNPVQFIDASMPGSPRKFYRSRLLPEVP